ncbi:MAG: hypothetical protein ACKV2T_00585 [Kofleriaceae bacterium]
MVMHLSAASIVRHALRVVILGTAIVAVVRGETLYGLYCVLALVVTLIPAVSARDINAGIPIELELGLLWLMFTDMTLGNSLGLYELAWFDKALHLTSSFLIALVAFLTIYVLHSSRKIAFRAWLDGIAIVLVTLGFGALWEIGEFSVDHVFGRRTQGAPAMSPLDDTMVDLVLDAVGGVLGATFGPLYMRYSPRSRTLALELGDLVAQRLRDTQGRSLAYGLLRQRIKKETT